MTRVLVQEPSSVSLLATGLPQSGIDRLRRHPQRPSDSSLRGAPGQATDERRKPLTCLLSVRAGVPVRAPSVTELAPKLKASTLSSYADLLRDHVNPRIGNVPLQKVTAAHLDALYAELLTRGRRDGSGALGQPGTSTRSSVRLFRRLSGGGGSLTTPRTAPSRRSPSALKLNTGRPPICAGSSSTSRAIGCRLCITWPR
jgi:hypothetical protein